MSNFTDSELEILIETFSTISDYDFSEYSKKSLGRRIDKILGDHHINIGSLIYKIKASRDFREKIVKEITVNTTELFRDPYIWTKIQQDIIPLFKNKSQINILHTGASIGLEVYSMVILLLEMGLIENSQIYATDLNSDVLQIAKTGKYKFREVDEFTNNFNDVFSNISDQKSEIPKLSNYFDILKNKHTIQVKPFLTKIPAFQIQDLVTQPNVFDVKYDIIFCRNVLIYFNHDLQNKIIHNFYNNLKPNGVLIIGRHEGILGPIATRFIKKDTIFIKK